MNKYKGVTISLLAGLVLGVLWTNLFQKNALRVNGIVDLTLLERYLLQSQNIKEYFLYLLKFRGTGYIVGTVFGISIFGVPMSLLWMAAMGFYIGMLLAATFTTGGLWGFVLGLGMLTPQYLLYIPASFLLFGRAHQMSMACWRGRQFTKKEYRQYFISIVWLLGALLVGILLEAWVNPLVLKFFMETLKII